MPPFSLTVVGPDHGLAGEARRLEREVFETSFNNTAEVMDREYGPYEAASHFLVVRSASGDVSGMMRVIYNSPAGLKSLNDVGLPPWQQPDALVMAGLACDLDYTIDVATLAIGPNYRGKTNEGEVWNRLVLFHGLCWYSQQRQARHWVAIVDDKVLAGIQRDTANVFDYYPGIGSGSYLDSPGSTPVWCDYLAYETRMRTERPDLEALYIHGTGVCSGRTFLIL